MKGYFSISLRRWFISKIMSALPLTRFYAFKRVLLKFANVHTSKNVRVVSSAKFYGIGDIIIGNNSFIGHEVLIVAAMEPVIIGDNVDIGPRVCIVNGSHYIGLEQRAGAGYSKKIVIGSGTWIGACAVIIAGVQIGERSVIGAGSVVVKDIASSILAAGNPCKFIKSLE